MIATEERPSTIPDVRYPGVPEAMDGTAAVVAMETAASEAAGAYPITPSTQMGEGWAVAAAEGRLNVNGRRLLFFEPEGEHAAAAVTAGMAMTGLRSANFSSGQGIAYMHESLYAAVGKRLTYVLNMACRAMTKHALNVHAGHDDYHAIDDTGFFQVFAKDAQEAADLNLIAHRVAELALTPGVCAQDGFLTSHVIESLRLPERELVREYLGDPADLIESPTPAQRLIYGERRRRIPESFDIDNPAMIGVVQNQDSYAQGVAAQRPFFFDHVAELADRAMDEYAALTGRRYRRASGYLTDDAEYAIVGQGSVVANAEAVADHLRRTRGLAIGVVNVSMFRPFPGDELSRLLAGKRAAVVLERADQPLAAEVPLLREIRAAMAKAVENGRAPGEPLPYPGIAALPPVDVPDFYSGCFGLGSRDLQAGDLVAAVDNMLADGRHRRQFYLGVEFVRPEEKASPALADWQKKILDVYPHVAETALAPAPNVSLLPEGSLAVRIHSVGGWGAMTMGKNLTLTLFNLLGMHVKSNPKYGSEKKGQPTTFYGVFAHRPIRTNCELKHVDVVLSPDPNVFRHSNPLAGLAAGGTFVAQHDGSPEELWQGLPAWVRKTIVRKKIRVFHLDAFAIARAETAEPDLQFRMQGGAFHGAFFKASPVMAREGLDEERLFAAVHEQLEKKFGHRGPKVVEENLRVIRRGYDEVRELDWAALPEVEDAVKSEAPSWQPPWYWTSDAAHGEGVADPLRFAGQVCAVYGEGQDPIADPFAALSAIPAATSVMRDMTGIRFEVPEFVAEKCTGCGQCWVQCPDAAIPGLVSEVRDVVRAGVYTATDGHPGDTLKDLIEPLAEASRKLLRENDGFRSFADVVTRAYESMELEVDAEARAALDAEFDAVARVMVDFPVARTAPFFTVPERREEGSGGLLSVTVNPYACKGCNLCVEVCPDEALISVKQDDGGDGAMLDIGFQNVSRLMASGKPIRVVVLDTQVYSNTGGQACTSGFHGQVSDMAAYGAARHGKEENRKEMSLIAMAHRGAYVLQSSQASPSHLIGGVLRGLSSRRPAIFNVYSPCQAEHGLPDSGSATAAKLAVESRAFPYLVYDPDRGTTFAERLDLDGNPDVDETWPTYELEYMSDDGAEQTLEVPLTVADWAATEPRFARHFKRVKASAWHGGMVPFHEFLELAPAEREGKEPFIYARDEERLGRLSVSREMVELAEDRLDLWDELRELAGVRVPERVRRSVTAPLERDYERKLEALREEYEQKLAELKATYPAKITRRIAEALVGGGTLAGVAQPAPAAVPAAPAPAPVPVPEPAEAVEAEPATPEPESATPEEESESIDPYIDTELCTTCNECTNLNPRMFAYDGDKKAYIKDPRAGTFAQLVQAAEKCTARIIHPGTPLDPDEPDLEKWVKRAAPFN